MYRHESYYGNANEFYCDFSIFWWGVFFYQNNGSVFFCGWVLTGWCFFARFRLNISLSLIFHGFCSLSFFHFFLSVNSNYKGDCFIWSLHFNIFMWSAHLYFWLSTCNYVNPPGYLVVNLLVSCMGHYNLVDNIFLAYLSA